MTTTEEQRVAQGRGKWSVAGVPHRGWVCIEVEDLGEPSKICEMCESTEVRFVHYMQNDTYADVLAVGCICAGHMSEDLAGARHRDDRMRSRSAKRKRWLSRRWKTSVKGNDWIKADDFIVAVYPKVNGWGATVRTTDRRFEQHSRRFYATPNEAKLAAFDLITRRLSH